jgi:hypothetical protein
MKAKTKRRVVHVLTKKTLIKRKTSRHILRSFLVVLATISTGSLAYAITLNKPVVGIAVHTSGAGGLHISAPVILNATPAPQSPDGPPAMTGKGSWYALGLPAPDTLTCASRTFPRGTYLLVKDLYNNHTVVCHVNDYGPEIWTGRIIDLSRGSFRAVDDLGRGTIPVELRVVSGSTGLRPTEDAIASVVGYAVCAKAHAATYCDAHRQD